MRVRVREGIRVRVASQSGSPLALMVVTANRSIDVPNCDAVPGPGEGVYF